MYNIMGEIEFPERLSDEEQQEYLEKFKQTKSDYYRNLLVEHNLRLVKSVVLQIIKKIPFYDVQELFSIGCEGLIKAVEKYDSTRASFSTFAQVCIKSEISHYFEYNLRVSRDADVVSIYKEVHFDENGNDITYMDILSNKDDEIETLYDEKDFKTILNIFLGTLSERDRLMFQMYYGLNEYEETIQEDIAKVFNLTHQTISRRNKNTLKKLKEYLVSIGYSYEEEFKRRMV